MVQNTERGLNAFIFRLDPDPDSTKVLEPDPDPTKSTRSIFAEPGCSGYHERQGGRAAGEADTADQQRVYRRQARRSRGREVSVYLMLD